MFAAAGVGFGGGVGVVVGVGWHGHGGGDCFEFLVHVRGDSAERIAITINGVKAFAYRRHWYRYRIQLEMAC